VTMNKAEVLRTVYPLGLPRRMTVMREHWLGWLRLATWWLPH
jgi:hypothetical protein